MKHWAMQHDQCKECLTTDNPHHAKGLCTSCYYKQYQKKHPPQRRAISHIAHQQGYSKGYEIGYYTGTAKATAAIAQNLEKSGVECYVSNDILHFSSPNGRFSVDLSTVEDY
jgi:hypothetical protein